MKKLIETYRTIIIIIISDFITIVMNISLIVILIAVNIVTAFSSPIILTARPWRHNRQNLMNIIESLAKDDKYCKSCNHNYEGYATTQYQNDDNYDINSYNIKKEGYKEKFSSIIIGKGYDDFQKASDILLSFRMLNNLSWYNQFMFSLSYILIITLLIGLK